MISMNRVLLLAICVIIVETGRAQTQLTRITSASDSLDLVDGGLYLFSVYVNVDGDKYGYANFYPLDSTYTPKDKSIEYVGVAPYYSKIESVVEGDDLLRLYKSGKDNKGNTRYLIYDVTKGYYLFVEGLFPSLYRHSSDEKNAIAKYMCITGSGKKFYMAIGDKRASRYQNNMKYYSFPKDATYNSNKSRYNDVQLYHIDKLEGYRNTMTSGSDIASMVGDTIITLDRQFNDNRLNTLMLPCRVYNYKEVFGLHVQAYEPVEDPEKGIVFRKFEGDDLKENAPYLISGKFAQAPYIITQTDVILPSDFVDNKVDVAINGIHFIGTYQDRRLDGQDAYMLSNDQLYYCKELNSNLKAFRWYLMTEDKKKSQFFIEQSNGKLSLIGNVGISDPSDNNTDNWHFRKNGKRPHGFSIQKGYQLIQQKTI